MIAIVVHGGAGGLPRDPERAERMRAGAAAAVEAGHAVLAAGGAALDAVEAAVVVLEDDPEFNAGRGAALTEYGRVELDASVMEGATRAAGAVAAVRGVRNPVKAARAVLAEGRHVLLVGAPATEFAATAGLAFEPETWFVTDRERRALNRRSAEPAGAGGPGASAARAGTVDPPDGDRPAGSEGGGPGASAAGGRRVRSIGGDVGSTGGDEPVESAGGTVGAVARDARGSLAAATSTGGVAGQRLGRVGDSPLVGAGTWADDDTVAVSCTGHGESIIRAALAHEVDALLRHADLPLEEACAAAIEGLARVGGDGGLIAVSARGEVAATFSSAAMTRAWQVGDGPVVTAVGPAEGG
jgi:L-asparaginase / beta-aspartyl-peptidase